MKSKGRPPHIIPPGVRAFSALTAAFVDHDAKGPLMNIADWTNVIQAICAIVSTICVAAALWVSVRQILLTVEQIRLSSQQAKRESGDRNRPYIAMDVVPGIARGGTWDLRIKNTGGTAARNIRISLRNSRFIPNENPDESKIYDKLIQFCNTSFDLMPSACRRLRWTVTDHNGGVRVGAPLQATIQVSYEWKDLDQARGYVDYLPYDCETLLLPVPASGSKYSGNPDKEQAKKIENALRAIAINVGEINR